MRSLRRLAQFVTRQVLRVALPYWRVRDPWEPLSKWVSIDALGPGSRRPFSWYHEGESAVPVADVRDVCAWLCTCRYVSDRALFQEMDFWQHPVTFEQVQRGDCEDHALWAWRKLIELGVDARFVVGSWRPPGRADWGVHAWVEYLAGGTHFHLEPLRNDREQMVQPLIVVRDHYAPHYSVDRSFEPTMHAGVILYYQRSQGPGVSHHRGHGTLTTKGDHDQTAIRAQPR